MKSSEISGKGVFFLLAFVEGASVMVLEAMTAKYLSPIYGDSIHVWATVVGLTLASLTVGYFAGSVLSRRNKNVLWTVLLCAGVYICFVPFLAEIFISHIITGSILRDCFMTGTICLFVPLSLLGAVPALLVAHIAKDPEEAGKVAGRVFGVSTVGGILAIFLAGFWIVPAFGVSLPLIVTGAVPGLTGAVRLMRDNRYLAMAGPAALVLALYLQSRKAFPESGVFRVRYYSEGILGQVLVGDFNYEDRDKTQRAGRALYVNRMPQTLIDLKSGRPLFSPYIELMHMATLNLPEGSDVLLLGLGGGSLVRKFRDRRHRVDVCELDERVVQASRKYFYPDFSDHQTRYITDDARHYLRTTARRYDMIVFDIFKGENPPHHAFTVEAFRDAGARLKPGGSLVVNFLGRIEGPRSAGPRAVIRTIREAGFATREIAIPNIDNVIVVAGYGQPPEKVADLEPYYIPEGGIDIANAKVLRDDRPLLELLHTDAARWNREWYNENYTYRFLEKDIPLFK